jgi:hypothetical protein
VIEPSPGVPAHIALLLNERFDFEDPAKVRKRLKSMARELRDQAEVSTPTFAGFSEKKPNELRVTLSGGLDLFSGKGACQEPACRIHYADQVARSIILMSDQVTMHDFFEEAFLELRSRPTNADIDEFVPDIYVLHQLKPLIGAGLVQFIPPYLPACSGCIAEFDRSAAETAKIVQATFSEQFSVERTDEYAAIHSGALFDPEVVIRVPNAYSSHRGDQELIETFLWQVIRNVLWDARDAAFNEGALFSNSPIGLSSVLHQEGHRFTEGEFFAFAGQRAAELPWVRGLTVGQTLQLREEAGLALPSLRQFLASKLTGAGNDMAPQDYVLELREQAAQVRAELNAVTSKSPSIRRNSEGIVGLGISALSIASGQPIAALSTLLATLGLIHVSTPDDTHANVLKTRPGYVLVAAENILNHAVQVH